jgi:hypothetical protein
MLGDTTYTDSRKKPAAQQPQAQQPAQPQQQNLQQAYQQQVQQQAPAPASQSQPQAMTSMAPDAYRPSQYRWGHSSQWQPTVEQIQYWLKELNVQPSVSWAGFGAQPQPWVWKALAEDVRKAMQDYEARYPDGDPKMPRQPKQGEPQPMFNARSRDSLRQSLLQ